MTRATKQLTRNKKDKFFKHFFAEENQLAPDLAEHLAKKSSETFSSVRVRESAFDAFRAAETSAKKPRPVPNSEPPRKSKPVRAESVAAEAGKPAKTPAHQEKLTGSKGVPPASEPQIATPSPTPVAAEPAAPFDAYSIGLVPTCQREGREGLMAKLRDIASTDNLREMARLQRIVIPSELRKGEAEPQAVREAIVSAVAKSIADKKTAAG